MTHSVIGVSAIALGVAAVVSLSPLSTARADMSAPVGPTFPTTGATSTPSDGAASTAASPGTEAPAVQPPARPYVRQYAHHYTRHAHHAWRNGHRYGYRNPVATGAAAVVGGFADLGSIAAYPVYCFPHYGSCPVYLPY